MVGGSTEAVDACRVYFDIFSQQVTHMGEAGAG